MPIYAEKIYDMCILLEICEKQDNMRNMRQSHSRVKLTCLTELHDWAQVDPVNRAFIGQVADASSFYCRPADQKIRRLAG